MKAVIQRVSSASVTVNRSEISRIGKGLCVLVGIGTDDTRKEMDYIISKMLSLRLFPDQQPPPNISTTPVKSDKREALPSGDEPIKQWTQSVRDIQGEILIVSQFTLMAKTKKGNKPDFHNAMKTDLSKALYTELVESLKTTYSEDLVQEGQFGAMMEVNISNDGPVTIIVDTQDK